MPKMIIATSMEQECRGVLAVAVDLAERLGSAATVVGPLAELAPGVSARAGHPALESLEHWVRGALPSRAAMPRVVARGGLPAVEIARYADEAEADLVVVGRGTGADGGALADAVVRRSRRPCLVLPCGWTRVAPVLVALDGTDRGFQVHQAACEFAERIRAPLVAVTVEPEEAGVRAAGMPSARSLRVQARVQAFASASPGGAALAVHAAPPVHVRTGDTVSQVVAEALELEAGILAVGWRWGGPSDRIPAGSVGRRLAHEAPCAVLTVPL
jgi:nucleotide-binding universal stress UspA family protein